MPSIGSTSANCSPKSDALREQQERTSNVSSAIRSLLTSESSDVINNVLAESHSAHEGSSTHRGFRARMWGNRKEKLHGYFKTLRKFPKDTVEKLKRKATKAVEKRREKKRIKGETTQETNREREQPAPRARGFEPRTGISQRNGCSTTSVVDWSQGTTLHSSWNPSPRSGPTLTDSLPNLAPLEESPSEDEAAGEKLAKEQPLSESPSREGPLKAKSLKSNGRMKEGKRLGKWKGQRRKSSGKWEGDRPSETYEMKVTLSLLGSYRRDERGSRFTEGMDEEEEEGDRGPRRWWDWRKGEKGQRE